MKIVEVFYSKLLLWMNSTASSPAIESLYNYETDETRKQEIISFIEYLRGEEVLMQESFNTLSLYPNYISLEEQILSFSSVFDSYRLEDINSILMIIKISKVIGDTIEDFALEGIYNSNDFVLTGLGSNSCATIPFYHYVNNFDFMNSFLLVSTDRAVEFETYIRDKCVDTHLLYLFMTKLSTSLLDDRFSKYVLSKVVSPSTVNSLISMIELHYVSDGLQLHMPQQYLDKPINFWRDEIVIENKYQQFTNTFYVISEYNESKDILSKYLKIYHVVEDFMYKHVLVELEKQRSGNLFSIRDFKRMYEEIDNKESIALRKFVNKVFELQYLPGSSMKDKLYSYWINFESTILPAEFTDLLQKFSVKQQPTSSSNYCSVLSTLIYSFRNSIVHNKTTEFHLTYNTLDDNIYKFLKLVLIPTLEEIIFLLISHHDKFMVWFQNDSLLLWNE